MKIVISGMGHCSAAGIGLEGLRKAWLDRAPIHPEKISVETARGPEQVSCLRVPNIVLPGSVPEAVERRMSRFSKMGMAVLAEALSDARVTPQENPQRMGLAMGTAFGNFDTANKYQTRTLIEGPLGASPTLFASSVHNSVAAQLTQTFGIRGPSLTVMTMEQSALGALRLAYDWICMNSADRAAVLIGDELSEYHLYYSAHKNCARPIGEGMHGFILEREELAKKAYARVSFDQSPSGAAETYQAALDGTHSHFYGRMVTGAGFEMGLAALTVERRGDPVHCVQKCRRFPSQTVTFLPVN
jgi:hypothetical protein